MAGNGTAALNAPQLIAELKKISNCWGAIGASEEIASMCRQCCVDLIYHHHDDLVVALSGKAPADDLRELAGALPMPAGYEVVEQLPGIWHYTFMRGEVRMACATSWNHPAHAAIAAWVAVASPVDALPDGGLSKSTAKRLEAQRLAQGEEGRSTTYSREALEIQGARWRSLCRTLDHVSPGWDAGLEGAVETSSAAVRAISEHALKIDKQTATQPPHQDRGEVEVTDAMAKAAEDVRVRHLNAIAAYGSAGVEERHMMAMRAALRAALIASEVKS